MGDISEEHELQVQTYLRFSHTKRKQHLKEVETVVKDVKDLKLDEAVYTKPDVEDLLDGIMAELDSVVDKELQHTVLTSGLLLRLIFKQAEQCGFELAVDTNSLENEALLGIVKESEISAVNKPASAFTKKANTLGKLQGGSGTDPKIIAERDSLKEELQAMKDKFQKLQLQTTTILKEKTAMGEDITKLKDGMTEKEQSFAKELEQREARVKAREEEVEKLKMSLEEADRANSKIQASSSDAIGSVSKEVSKLKSTVGDLEEQLRVKNLEVERQAEQITSKLNESKQFLTMKKMMQTKTQQLQQVRKRLAMYEPPDENITDADM